MILSNHGGRQLDAAVSPLDVLAESRARISAPILIDSGYRRGTDIVKALALGANAVLLGRPTLYGLAAVRPWASVWVLRLLAALYFETNPSMVEPPALVFLMAVILPTNYKRPAATWLGPTLRAARVRRTGSGAPSLVVCNANHRGAALVIGRHRFTMAA